MLSSPVKVLIIACIGLFSLYSVNVSAASPGFYFGTQLGVADGNYNLSDLGLASGAIKNHDFSGRLHFGYQINHNIASEIGATYLARVKVKNINGTGSRGRVQQYAIDAMAKLILPVAMGFYGYGKAGFALFSSKANSVLRGLSINSLGHNVEPIPVYALGAGYDITDNITTDVSWTRYVGSAQFENTDLIAGGIAYHFG